VTKGIAFDVEWKPAASAKAWHYDLFDGEICFARDITMGNSGAASAVRKRLKTRDKSATIQTQPRLPFSPRKLARQLKEPTE